MAQTKPQRRIVGSIVVPAEAWDRVFGDTRLDTSYHDRRLAQRMGDPEFRETFEAAARAIREDDVEALAALANRSARQRAEEAVARIHGDDKPNPEVAQPGQWVDVTCRNHECPEFERFETSVGEPVYDVLPPSCPRCGHELEAI